MGLFPNPIKVLRTVRNAASSVSKGKIKTATRQVASAVNQISGSPVIQAVFAPVAIPQAIVSAGIAGGPKAAIAAAHGVLKNPVLRAGYVAAGIAFPPFAPLSAGAIASMEAASRLLDAYESKDPKVAAAAALQLAKTIQNAVAGDPGAARARQVINEIDATRDIFGDYQKGAPDAKKAIDALKARAAAGDKRAQAGVRALEFVSSRAAIKGKVPVKGHLMAHREKPDMMALVSAAVRTPSGIRIGDFSVLKTGRILHKGKPVRK